MSIDIVPLALKPIYLSILIHIKATTTSSISVSILIDLGETKVVETTAYQFTALLMLE